MATVTPLHQWEDREGSPPPLSKQFLPALRQVDETNPKGLENTPLVALFVLCGNQRRHLGVEDIVASIY